LSPNKGTPKKKTKDVKDVKEVKEEHIEHMDPIKFKLDDKEEEQTKLGDKQFCNC